MKYLLIFLALTLASCGMQQPKEINLLSYNVKNCNGLDGKTDYKRIADIISDTQADVVALQELDSVTRRSNGVYVLGELEKLTGMYATYAPAIDFSGGKYGIGILSKEKPLETHVISLPGREEARTCLIAEFSDYWFFATHLSLTPEDQLLSASVINQHCELLAKKPVFVAGDMNSTPGDDTQNALAQQLTVLSDTTAYTYPADTPDRCIDYIYVSKAYGNRFETVKQAVIADSIASDHRPVQVVIRTKK